MNTTRLPRFSLTEALLAILLMAASLQVANAYGWSLCGGLAYSWIGTGLILLWMAACLIKFWLDAPSNEKAEFISAWAWPLPWLFLGVLSWQIAVYPPSMHDSLCYRLPRIFLWLQENAISRPDAPDGRIIEMPWGWELLALPMVAVNGVKLVALLNLSAWAVLFVLAHHHALASGAGIRKARWLALATSTAPVCLLQATSAANDLFAAVLLIVSCHFILMFERAPHWSRTFLSLLAFMMACGVKPHFLVLGVGWGAWWLFDPSKPWRYAKPLTLVLTSLPVLLVSPLPIFISNHLASGSIFGSGIKEGLEGGSPGLKTLAASLQFLSAQLQLPIMPGAERISAVLQNFGPSQALQQQVPKFQPMVGLIPIIDSASFGLIHFGMIVAGLALGWRVTERRLRWLAVIAVTCFLMAGATVVPGTIGRSFLGFGAILIIPAVTGLARKNGVWVPVMSAIAVGSGFLAMVMNPSSPAWPSRTMEDFSKNSGKTGWVEKLDRYHSYQERANTGSGFLDPVPRGETVGVLLRGLTPTVRLWTPDWRRHRIAFVHHLPVEEFQARGDEWLIIGENASEMFPEQVATYRTLRGWKVVREESFLPTLSGGPERWTLYQRVTVP